MKPTFVTHNGRTQTIVDWSAEAGLERTTIRKRLKAGWSVERALTTGDTRGLHMTGRTRSEAVRKKISAGLLARKTNTTEFSTGSVTRHAIGAASTGAMQWKQSWRNRA